MPSYRDVRTLEYLVEVKRAIERSPSAPSELERGLKIPHKTLYRILSCLEEAGVIHKREDGRYEVVKEWQEFRTPEEYRAMLDHSRKILVERCRKEFEEDRWFEADPKLLEDGRVLQHLRTGYPEIYVMYEEWRRARDELRGARGDLEGEVARIAESRGFEVVDVSALKPGRRQVSNLATLVERYSGRMWWLRGRPSIAWDGEYVVDRRSGLRISRSGEHLREIKDLVGDLLGSEALRKAVERLFEAEKRHAEAMRDYAREVERLAEKVDHGEPLRGACDLCPRVVIRDLGGEGD